MAGLDSDEKENGLNPSLRPGLLWPIENGRVFTKRSRSSFQVSMYRLMIRTSRTFEELLVRDHCTRDSIDAIEGP
jgi:hypothetical protein